MNNTKKNKKRIFNFLKIILSLLFIGWFFNHFFLNNDALVEDIFVIVSSWDKFIFVILSMIFGALAYVSRGLRWVGLIDALGYKTSKINSISAVSVGYFTNVFIPRAGEISRCLMLKKSDNIPTDKLLGTILIERIIDFTFLLFIILISIFLKSKELIQSFNEYQQKREGEGDPSSTKFIILGSLLFIGILIYLFRNKIKQNPFYNKATQFIEGFKEGFKSIKNIKNKRSFWFHTFGIWIMYLLMTYICFQCIDETSNLTVYDGLFVLTLGAIGMILPTPGGLGSYHYFVMIALLGLSVGNGFYSTDYESYNPALLFPFVVHLAQTVISFIMGPVGLLILFMNKKQRIHA